MIAKPLAEHGISIFQVSTFDADYTLVPEDRLAGALEALRSVFRVNVDEETREDLRRRSASTVSSSRASVHSTTALSSSAVASSLVMTDDGSAPVDVDASTAIFNMDGLGTSLDAAPSSPTSTTATRHEFSRPIGDSPLAIASFRLGSGRGTSSMWMSVFRLMFYNPTKRLFSITMVDDQVSMVVERDSLAGFPLEWMSVYQLEHVDEVGEQLC